MHWKKLVKYHRKLHSYSGTVPSIRGMKDNSSKETRNTPTYFSTSGVIGFSLLGEETSYTCYKWI